MLPAAEAVSLVQSRAPEVRELPQEVSLAPLEAARRHRHLLLPLAAQQLVRELQALCSGSPRLLRLPQLRALLPVVFLEALPPARLRPHPSLPLQPRPLLHFSETSPQPLPLARHRPRRQQPPRLQVVCLAGVLSHRQQRSPPPRFLVLRRPRQLRSPPRRPLPRPPPLPQQLLRPPGGFSAPSPRWRVRTRTRMLPNLPRRPVPLLLWAPRLTVRHLKFLG